MTYISDKELDWELKNNQVKPKIEITAQIVILIFYILIFFKNYIEDSNLVVQLMLTACFVGIGICSTIFFVYKLKTNSLIVILIILLIFSSISISFVSKNYRLVDVFLTLSYFGIGLIPVFYRLNETVFKYMMYAMIVFFTYHMFNDIPADQIFNVSRNFVSVLLLIGVSYHFISCFQNDKMPSIIITIISLVISIWATGRGGIIAFSLLLIFLPFIVNVKTRYKVLLIAIVISLSLFVFYNFYDFLFEYGLGRFEEKGLEGARTTMNFDYFNNSIGSIFNFLFGSFLLDIPSIAEVDGNPHNSFIRLHVFYGFLGVLLFLILFVYAMLFYIRKHNYLFVLLLFVIVLRSYLDSTSFHGPFDPVIYFLLFYPIKNITIVK